MEEKKLLEGKYLTYKGKPLVRERNVIVYGDMQEKYYLFLMILSTETVNNTEYPNKILVQILSTDGKQTIYKQGEKSNLHDAIDIGIIWLNRALAS